MIAPLLEQEHDFNKTETPTNSLPGTDQFKNSIFCDFMNEIYTNPAKKLKFLLNYSQTNSHRRVLHGN